MPTRLERTKEKCLVRPADKNIVAASGTPIEGQADKKGQGTPVKRRRRLYAKSAPIHLAHPRASLFNCEVEVRMIGVHGRLQRRRGRVRVPLRHGEYGALIAFPELKDDLVPPRLYAVAGL